MDDKQRTGFTKTGFSKSGFAACSHFNECKMGRLPCYYEEIDPEVKEYCACYQRNNPSKEGLSINQEKSQEQLSLF